MEEGRRCLNPITGLAQSVERGPFKPNVAGSSTAIGIRVGGLFQNHYFLFLYSRNEVSLDSDSRITYCVIFDKC